MESKSGVVHKEFHLQKVAALELQLQRTSEADANRIAALTSKLVEAESALEKERERFRRWMASLVEMAWARDVALYEDQPGAFVAKLQERLAAAHVDAVRRFADYAMLHYSATPMMSADAVVDCYFAEEAEKARKQQETREKTK